MIETTNQLGSWMPITSKGLGGVEATTEQRHLTDAFNQLQPHGKSIESYGIHGFLKTNGLITSDQLEFTRWYHDMSILSASFSIGTW